MNDQNTDYELAIFETHDKGSGSDRCWRVKAKWQLSGANGIWLYMWIILQSTDRIYDGDNVTLTVTGDLTGTASKNQYSSNNNYSVNNAYPSFTFYYNDDGTCSKALNLSMSATTAYWGDWEEFNGRITTGAQNVTIVFPTITSYTHHLYYVQNGGSGYPSTQTITNSSLRSFSATISDTRPTDSGKTFLGWGDYSDVVRYNPGSTYTFNTGSSQVDYWIYPVWGTLYDHVLTYNANGGSGAPSAQTIQSTNEKRFTATISSTIPTRSGYVFKGWGSSSNASNAIYIPGHDYELPVSSDSYNITIYAIWEPEHTVFYNGTGGTYIPSTVVSGVSTTGFSGNITTEIPVREERIFKGWDTSNEARTVVYNPGDPFESTESTLTLYAVWQSDQWDEEEGYRDHNWLDFFSGYPFTVKLSSKTWDGIIEYSLDSYNWSTYSEANTEIQAVPIGYGYHVFFRGNNSYLSSSASNYTSFILSGQNDIRCRGNLAYILGDKEDITLPNYCFYRLFSNCTSLIEGPDIPLGSTVGNYACNYMFNECTRLHKTPLLRATTINSHGYDHMFYRCSNLWAVQGLPAVNLGESCYESMFENCTTMVRPPKLPSFSLAVACYKNMFKGCTKLEYLPYLYATTLPDECYSGMFQGCSNIKLSTSQTGNYWSKTRIPQLDSATVGTNSLANMFTDTGGTFTGAPTADTTYYLEQVAAIKFVSKYPFTFRVSELIYRNSLEGHEVEFSFDGSNWIEYGNKIDILIQSNLVNGVYTMYLRGTISTKNGYTELYITDGIDVHSIGSVLTVVNYESAKSNSAMPLTGYYLTNLFNGSTFITAPDLICTTNVFSMQEMYRECTKLIEAPELYVNIDVNTIDPNSDFTMHGQLFGSMFLNDVNLVVPPTIIKNVAISGTYMYYKTFERCFNLVNPPKMVMPDTLTNYCFGNMFRYCRSLQGTPDLPCTTLANYCYYQMFDGCHTLKHAMSSLPATTVPGYAYEYMFRDCYSLLEAPSISATTLTGTYNMYGMFQRCRSLTVAPEINVTTLGDNYSLAFMFSHCDKLVTPPSSLPATTATSYCYNSMFAYCLALTSVPTIALTSTADRCCYLMFSDCISLEDASNLILRPTSVATYGYGSMFYNCARLKQLPDISAITTVGSYGMSSMFYHCFSLETPPSLSGITSLSDHGFYQLFEECSALTTAPTLPLTSVPSYGYAYMFRGCLSLEQPPELPATTLGTYCYCGMFSNCEKLASVPTLAATTLSVGCYYSMFSSAWSIEQLPDLPATVLPDYCYYNMFASTDGLISATEGDGYTKAWKLPSSGTITSVGNNSLTNMVSGLGGDDLKTPEANTTYYQIPSIYTVTFDSNGGSSADPLTNTHKINVNMPTPTKSGYIFAGWYTDNTFEERVAVARVLKENLIAYAKWEKSPTFDEIKDKALFFSADTNFTFKWLGFMTNGNIVYSLDGVNWTGYKFGDTITTTNKKLYLMGRFVTYICRNRMTPYLWFSTKVKCTGDLAYVFNYYTKLTGGSPSTTTYGASMAFALNPMITTAPELSFNTSSSYFFYGMFTDSIIEQPPTVLPITSVSEYAYYNMFYRCFNLKSVPDIKATTLNGDYCFENMFYSNLSLKYIPKKLLSKISTMPNGSCYYMFGYCYLLRNACDLPATTVGTSAYNNMFNSCWSLTKAPSILPALTLDTRSYYYMFSSCIELPNAPVIEATTYGEESCSYMFAWCYRLMSGPEIKATTVAKGSCSYMFNSDTDLRNITSSLPATTLAESCYEAMFNSCSNLKYTPEILATTLAKRCCYRMFSYCYALKRIALLPVTTLAESCYQQMFMSCYFKMRTTEYNGYVPYRVPSSGTGVTATNAMTDMFKYVNFNPSGTEAQINTTYYIQKVQENKDLVKVNGTWRYLDDVYVKVGGSWRKGTLYEIRNGEPVDFLYY